jgi:DNA-binding response OmpR family regulator
MRILIAEDDVTSRALLRLLITKRGHEPVVTVNGTEALSAMQQPDAPSLAILDWMMPELDGIDVCRRIREVATERPPYIIMLTTKGETADIVAGLVAGADDYLTKPFDANELYARVDVGRRLLDLQAVLAGKVEELRDALAQIKTLRGTVPICACCKKIRDDKGYWKQVEVYVRDHTEAQFSHGICPECSAKLYPE